MDAANKLQQGDALAARRGLEKVARAAPRSAAVWYNMALAAQHLGLHDKAIHEYQKSLALAPDQVEAVINIGLSLHELEQHDEAIDSAKQALKLNPAHPRALNLLGSIYAERRDFDNAREVLERCLENDPQNADARQNLANALLESGLSEQAETVLAPLISQTSPTRDQLELQGQILLDLRKFEEVQPLIKHLKARFPGDQGVQILEMSFCELINDNFSVVDIARAILAEDPAHARVWNSLGSAYFQLDSIENARASYEKAIEFDQEQAEYRE